jgi:pimeloyl-ACP methyl ester carboxylesterase
VRRGLKILIAALAVLAALLAVNTIVVDGQTKEAGVTVDGGEILTTPRGDVQAVEQGPTGAAPARAGAPIVLLHCYTCSLHWYERIAPILARRHRVIRIDLLGHGGSEKPASGYAIDEQAAIVAAALNELGVEGATVVGNSMGGAVAVALAEQASQLADRIVILDMAPDHDCCGDLPLLARVARWPVIGEALWRAHVDTLVKSQYGEAFAPGFDVESGFDDPDQVVDDLEAMTFTAYREATEETDAFVDELPLDERITRAAVPLLVAFGAEDQIVDAEKALAGYEGVPGVRTELIPDAGYAPQVEQPQRTAELVEAFAAEGEVGRPRRASR